MAKEIGRQIHGSADNAWKWRGRDVFLADGTGFTMQDTPENQLRFDGAGISSSNDTELGALTCKNRNIRYVF